MESTNSFIATAVKNLQSKRAFCTPVEFDDKLFIIGGCDAAGKPVNLFDSYDPKTAEWTRLPDLPLSTAQPCVVVVDKYIVVLGGVAVNQDPLDIVQIYDTELKKWKSGDRMKEKLLGVAGVLHGKEFSCFSIALIVLNA